MAHSKKSKYFKVHELVSKNVYNRFSETVIMNRMNSSLIDLIDWIREGSGVPIVINNWKSGGNFSQRGLRSNVDPIVSKSTSKGIPTLSPHVLFMAVDMNPAYSSGKSAEWLWDWIYEHAKESPCDFRMENKTATVNSNGEVSWVHVDVATPDVNPKGSKEVHVFNP